VKKTIICTIELANKLNIILIRSKKKTSHCFTRVYCNRHETEQINESKPVPPYTTAGTSLPTKVKLILPSNFLILVMFMILGVG
jgi:hypothetical protein